MAKRNNYLWLLTIPVLLIILRRGMPKKTGYITKNFAWDEFQSNDGSVMPNDVAENIKELAENLQVIRDYIKKPIKINSAYRSPDWNRQVGGVSDSQHVKGKASDIVISGLSSTQVVKIIEDLIASGKIKQGGVGLYPNFVHYDIRGTKARWKA
jgi:uncharacterized protein YcbK (DUF882 family)